MLENYQRAAQVPNDPNITWHQFVLSRFVGRVPGTKAKVSMALVIQLATQHSGNHAELTGLVEYASENALPIVFPFVGTLHLDTRDISIEEAHHEDKSYVGSISENGRVITLRSIAPDGTKTRPFHLIHEETQMQLTGE